MAACLPFLVALLLPQSPESGLPQAEFARGLAAARRAADRGEWQTVLQSLARLLKEHEDRDYVRIRRTEIRDLHRRATFRASTRTPDPRTLVDGELSHVDLRHGRVKIRYRSFHLDFVDLDGLSQHNARFLWPLTVTIEGSSRTPGLHLQFGEADRVFTLRCRPDEPPVLEAPDGNVALSRTTRTLPVGRPFQVTLKIDPGTLTATLDQQPWFRATLPPDRTIGRSGGQLALRQEGIDALVLDGRAEPSWLQGLVDEALHLAHVRFARDYEARFPLPDWLSRPVLTTGVEAPDHQDNSLDALDGAEVGVFEECERLLARGAARTALAYLDGLAPVQLPPATWTALRVSVLLHLGRHQDALRAVDLLQELAPEALHTKKLRADVMVALGRKEEAQDLWRDLVDARPGRADFYVEAAAALLAFGDTGGARRWIEQAHQRKVASRELNEIHRILVKAERGPDWPRVSRAQSPHFLVTSDMDQATSEQVARVLEDSLALFRSVLGHGDPAGRAPFRVHVFSGRSGYQRYARALWGRALPAHTEGFYSPMLKQTLVWNLPSREQMLRVVRHEAFHHYLDHRMRHPPVWLDEGFAEYFMDVQRGPSPITSGPTRQDHVGTLRELGLVPLVEFVELEPGGFRADPRRHYAQAYALCHFLRHGGPEAEATFARLWELLVDGHSGQEAIEAVFDPERLAILQPLFEAHVAGM